MVTYEKKINFISSCGAFIAEFFNSKLNLFSLVA